ncbi:MAG: hypothetical protein WB611_33360 [Stellaceae bacterium]
MSERAIKMNCGLSSRRWETIMVALTVGATVLASAVAFVMLIRLRD